MNHRHRNRRQRSAVMKRDPRAPHPADRDHVNRFGQPKHRFTRRAALQFVAHHPHMKAYRCPRCGGWHVTHRPQENP